MAETSQTKIDQGYRQEVKFQSKETYFALIIRRVPWMFSNFERIIIPELNTGQLIKLIRERFLIDAKGINKVAGEPFTAQELAEKIEEKINE